MTIEEVRTAYEIELGGVSACNPDIYWAALKRIAESVGCDPVDEEFLSMVRTVEGELPCPID